MRKLVIASLFLSGAASAQMPPPSAPNQEPVPITLDVRTQEQIKTFLADAQYKHAAPIINLIDQLQREHQIRAASEAARARAQAKPEAK